MNDINEFVKRAYVAYLRKEASRDDNGELLYKEQNITYSIKVLDPENNHYNITRHKDGVKRTTGEYKNGKLNGKWVVWYNENNVEYTADMINGKVHGHDTHYFRNGDLMAKNKFVMGTRV